MNDGPRTETMKCSEGIRFAAIIEDAEIKRIICSHLTREQVGVFIAHRCGRNEGLCVIVHPPDKVTPLIYGKVKR